MSERQAPTQERIVALIRRHLPAEDLWVSPEVPAKKERNARRTCEVPASELVLGLVDATVFGSAKNALIFGLEGLYLHNDSTAETPGASRVQWHELEWGRVGRVRSQSLRVAPGCLLDLSGSSCPADTLVALLRELATEFGTPAGVEDDGADLPVEQRIARLLHTHDEVSDLYVAPRIPAEKLANAREACGVPTEEEVIGLVDCTVFGSAKHAVVLGTTGIRYHNPWSGQQPGAHALTYAELARRPIRSGDAGSVDLGEGDNVDMSGSAVPPETLIPILTTLARWFGAPGAAADPGSLPGGLAGDALAAARPYLDPGAEAAFAERQQTLALLVAPHLPADVQIHTLGVAVWSTAATVVGRAARTAALNVAGLLLASTIGVGFVGAAKKKVRAGVLVVGSERLWALEMATVDTLTPTLADLQRGARPGVSSAPLGSLTTVHERRGSDVVLRVSGALEVEALFSDTALPGNTVVAAQIAAAVRGAAAEGPAGGTP